MGRTLFLHVRIVIPRHGHAPVLQALANLFPLRHYFLIYVDQALNGYPMIYSWVNYVALLIFMMLPVPYSP